MLNLLGSMVFEEKAPILNFVVLNWTQFFKVLLSFRVEWLTIWWLLLLYVFLDASTKSIGEEAFVGEDLADEEFEELVFRDLGRYL